MRVQLNSKATDNFIPVLINTQTVFPLKGESFQGQPEEPVTAKDLEKLQIALDNETGNYLTIKESIDKQSYTIALWSKSDLKLSSIVLPKELPSTENMQNRYLKVSDSGEIFWAENKYADYGALIYTNTAEYWDSQPTLQAEKNAIYIYKDAYTWTEGGVQKTAPGIKIGVENKTLLEIPFIFDAIQAQLNNKVDKIEGKGLSTNDFTDELKEKVLAADIKEIILPSEQIEGTITEAEAEALKTFKLVFVQYNKNIYKLSSKRLNEQNQWIYTYYSLQNEESESNFIHINLSTFVWEYSGSRLYAKLIDHIEDNVSHITQNERTSWTNKLHSNGVKPGEDIEDQVFELETGLLNT